MGKPVLVAIWVLLTLVMVAPASEAASDVAATGTMAAWLRLVFLVLKVGVMAVFTVAVITRGEAKQRSRDPVAFVACTIALGSGVVLEPPGEWSTTSSMLVGELIALVSSAGLLAAVVTLGRSFSVLPEARELVTRGLYGRVRHPVYVGEFGVFAGLLIAAPTVVNIVAVALFVGGQAVRIRLEESALKREFPEYAAYAARTPRFIPRPRFGMRSAEAAGAEAA